MQIYCSKTPHHTTVPPPPLPTTDDKDDDDNNIKQRYLPAPHIVQELCESRGGRRPGLSVLTSLMVSVDRKAILNHAHALVSACP